MLEGSILPELLIKSVIPCFNDTILATMFNEPSRPQRKSKLVLWNISNFTPASELAVPLSSYCALDDKVEVLIDNFATGLAQSERLIFLHDNQWVCTADSQTVKADRFV